MVNSLYGKAASWWKFSKLPSLTPVKLLNVCSSNFHLLSCCFMFFFLFNKLKDRKEHGSIIQSERHNSTIGSKFWLVEFLKVKCAPEFLTEIDFFNYKMIFWYLFTIVFWAFALWLIYSFLPRWFQVLGIPTNFAGLLHWSFWACTTVSKFKICC